MIAQAKERGDTSSSKDNSRRLFLKEEYFKKVRGEEIKWK